MGHGADEVQHDLQEPLVALAWAAGMIWLALDISTPDGPADGNQVAASDSAGDALTNADVDNLIVANL